MCKKFRFFQTINSGRDNEVLEMTDLPVVFFKFYYTQPYEKFNEIFSLQKVLRRENLFDYKITLSVDVTEWTGHESEEFFHIFMMYLHDMPETDLIFTSSSTDRESLKKMFFEMRKYIFGTIHFEDLNDEETLESQLENEFSCSHDAAESLAEIIVEKMPDFNNEAMVSQLINEIRMITGAEYINEKSLEQYLNDSNSIIFLCLGNILNEEKGVHTHGM